MDPLAATPLAESATDRAPGLPRSRRPAARAVALALSGAALVLAGALFVPRWMGAARWTDGSAASIDLREARVRHALWSAPEPVAIAGTLPGPIGRAALAPDGAWLALAVGEEGHEDLYLAARSNAPGERPAFGAPRPVPGLAGPARELAPAFSAGALWFASDREGGAGGLDLWRAPFDRASGAVGTPAPAGDGINGPDDELDPGPSADEEHVAFARAARAAGGSARLELASANGTGGWDCRVLAALDGPGEEREPLLADDGRLIFAARQDGDSRLVCSRFDRGEWLAPQPFAGLDGPGSESAPARGDDRAALCFLRRGAPGAASAAGSESQPRAELVQARTIELYERPLGAPAAWQLALLGALASAALLAWLTTAGRLSTMGRCALASLVVHLLILVWLAFVHLRGAQQPDRATAPVRVHLAEPPAPEPAPGIDARPPTEPIEDAAPTPAASLAVAEPEISRAPGNPPDSIAAAAPQRLAEPERAAAVGPAALDAQAFGGEPVPHAPPRGPSAERLSLSSPPKLAALELRDRTAAPAAAEPASSDVAAPAAPLAPDAPPLAEPRRDAEATLALAPRDPRAASDTASAALAPGALALEPAPSADVLAAPRPAREPLRAAPGEHGAQRPSVALRDAAPPAEPRGPGRTEPLGALDFGAFAPPVAGAETAPRASAAPGRRSDAAGAAAADASAAEPERRDLAALLSTPAGDARSAGGPARESTGPERVSAAAAEPSSTALRDGAAEDDAAHATSASGAASTGGETAARDAGALVAAPRVEAPTSAAPGARSPPRAGAADAPAAAQDRGHEALAQSLSSPELAGLAGLAGPPPARARSAAPDRRVAPGVRSGGGELGLREPDGSEAGVAAPAEGRARARADYDPLAELTRTAPGPSSPAPAASAARAPERAAERSPGVAAPSAASPLAGLSAPAPAAAPEGPARLADTPYRARFGSERERALDEFGGGPETERAVALGLAYLASVQRPGGLWGDAADRDQKYGDVRIGKTGLALLAFLGAGHTPASGTEYTGTVARAVEALCAALDPATGQLGDGEAYSHGIATYALAEYYALTKDAAIRPALERAVERILGQQERGGGPARHGGWSYFYADGHEFDGWPRTSITAWQVMALESARLGGLEVPGRAFDDAHEFLLAAAGDSGPFVYSHDPERTESEWPTLPGSTPAGLFALSLLGERLDEPRWESALQFVSQRAPRGYRCDSPDAFVRQAQGNTYFWYYGTLALFRRGGAPWERWNVALKDALLPAQNPDGSWSPIDPYCGYAGDDAADMSYATAVCVLSLEVYYRYFTPLLRVE